MEGKKKEEKKKRKCEYIVKHALLDKYVIFTYE
jgi:hypothetical protein